MLKFTRFSLFVAALMLGANFSYAEEAHSMDNMNMQKNMGNDAMQIHKGHGVVKKINVNAGKVNITHEPIDSMGWPKMTMDFSVEDKAGLAAVKPGMKVDFDLTQTGKRYSITNITPAKE